MTIIAFDPGQTTGYAIFSKSTRQLIQWGQFTVEEYRVLDGLIHTGYHCVYEKLTNRHPSFNPIGMEIIGAIKHLCWQRDATWSFQTPGQITGVQKWPCIEWPPKLSPHEKDAISHGLVYLKATKLLYT